MRVLAEGFLTLSTALSSHELHDLVDAIPSAAPIAVPDSAASATVASAPVPIREQLPAWTPKDEFARTLEFRGAVRVSITADGTVEAADIVRPIHPAYDELLQRAATTWTYQPARVNGRAVPSERVITVVLRPR
jgi:TonB family protein